MFIHYTGRKNWKSKKWHRFPIFVFKVKVKWTNDPRTKFPAIITTASGARPQLQAMTCALERISVIVDRESLSEAAEGDILVDVAWKASEKQKRLTTGPPDVKCYCRGSWVGFSLKVKAGADYVCDLCLRKDFGYGELLGEEGVAKIFGIVCYFYKRYIKEERETRTCK